MFGTTGGGEADVTSAGNFCHLFAATTANTAAGAITSNPIATAATSFSTTAADVALSTLPPPPLVSCALTDANVVSSIFSMSAARCATLAPPTSPPTTSSSSSAALNNALLFNSVVNATASVALSPPSVAPPPPPPPPPPPTAGTFSAEAIGRLFNELLQKQQELSNQAAAVGANAALPLTSVMLSQQPASLLGAQHYQLSAATLPPRAIRQGGGDASFPLFQFPTEPLNSISATTLAGRPPSQPQQQQMSAPSYPPPPSYAEALLHEQQEQNRLLLKQMEAIAAAASMTTSTTATPTSNHCTAVTQHDQQQQRQLLLNKPIMSPDISRLAADTTAVSLTDKSEETVVERSTPGCSTTSQDSRATCIDETPLDLSTRSKAYSSSSSSCSSGNTHSQPPKPSTSSQSRQNTPPQLLTPPMKGPLRASLKHIKQGQFGGFGTPTCSGGGGGGGGGGSTSGGKSIEVKRSASSVTYRAFDPDVSEHFRRSLSGKWPRRQLNYASYYKEGDPHHHHLVDEEEDYYSPTAEIRPPQSITSNAVPTTSTTTNGSGGVGELSAAKTAQPSSRFNALFSRKPFWRKTSTASSSSGAVSPSPDGKVMLTASVAASPSPLSVLDERSAITTGVANNSLLMDQQCQRVPSASSVSSTSGLTTTTPKKLSSSGTNVMTKIIVNEARQVEDHFRMALGEKTFQLLKSAQQKSLTPTPNSRRLMNGETRPTPPPPPQSSSGEPFLSASDYGVDGCANYSNPELFHTPTTTTRAQQQLVVAGLNNSSGHDGACNNNGANEMMCISRL